MVYLGSDAVIVNEHGQLLLIKREDSRTWALPGGGVERDESPADAVVREVEEETGLKTMAVRLVGLFHRAEPDGDQLTFSFRCLQRGGTLQPGPEALQAGYVSLDHLPAPMLPLHRRRALAGAYHDSGAPEWRRESLPSGIRWLRRALYRWRDWRRRQRGLPPFPARTGWRAAAFVVLRDESGNVLWVQRADDHRWNLPGGGVNRGEAPWDAAVRETMEETGLAVRLTDLIGVYTKPAVGEVVFSFAAVATSGTLTTGAESLAFQYLPPDAPPANALVNHVSRVADAAAATGGTLFRQQPSQRS